MVPVLGTPYISRPDLLNRLISSVDFDESDVRRVVVIDNSPDNSLPGLPDDDGFLSVIRTFHNLGVAASWNLIIKVTPLADWWCIVNADIAFGEGDLDRLAEVMETTGGLALLGSFVAFGVTAEVIERVGFFDENLHPAYCLAPDTPVLMADLRWGPIGRLEVGDRLVGVDEYPIARHKSRAYRPSTVTGVSRRVADCVRLRMDDGREVVCSTDHKWLSKSPARTMAWRWMEAANLGPGYHISAPLRTWASDRSFEAGWLAGIIDGEGTLHHSGVTRTVEIAQKEGFVLAEVQRVLAVMGLPFTWRVRPDNSVAVVEVGSHRHAMELMGRLRPVRFMPKSDLLWDGAHPRSRSGPSALRIASVEHLGPTEVVSIETTTKTFIANGMVSHNCEDNDYAYRCKLAGVSVTHVPNSLVHEGSATIHSSERYRKENDRTFPQNKRYYVAKWGGMPDEETYTTPFNLGGDIRATQPSMNRLRSLTWR